MPKKERVYSINNISEQQLVVIMRALDTYSRLGMLQLDRAILDEIRYSEEYDYLDCRDIVDANIFHIKKRIADTHKHKDVKDMAAFNSDGWSLGIGSEHTPLNCKMAYEIYKAITNKRWLDNDDPKRPYTVDANVGLVLTSETKVIVESQTVRAAKAKEILE